MKLSIITCTWNSELWLAESIASVAAQDYPNVEKIFVDGGSTDRTLALIAQVGGDVKVLHDVRGGISRAMNAGVAVATGDVIAHMHSDDFYLGQDVFSRVAAALSTSDAAWLYGRCKTVEAGVLTDNSYAFKPYSWDALIRRNIVPHQSTFLRRDLFNALGGFDEGLRYAMDYDLWLRAAKRGAPVQSFDYLAAFRFHAGSLSTRQARATHSEEWRVRMRHAGPGLVERTEHLVRHGVRKVKLSLRSQSSGGFRAT